MTQFTEYHSERLEWKSKWYAEGSAINDVTLFGHHLNVAFKEMGESDGTEPQKRQTIVL